MCFEELSIFICVPIFIASTLELFRFKKSSVLKGLLMGCSISILNKESYHYALCHDMTHTAWVMQSTCGRDLWPVNGI